MKPDFLRIALVSALALLGAGCGSLRRSSGTMETSAEQELSPAKATQRKLPSNAGMNDMVERALASNPAIAAADAKITRMEAKARQARALPDPMAMVSLGNMAETAAGRVTAMTGLQQKVPFPGKLGAKGLMADEETSTARAMRDAKALSIATQVKSSYWDLYLADHSIRILSDSRRLLESVQSAVEARLKTNRANQADLLQVTTETARIDDQLIQARRDRVTSSARLNTLMHRPVDAKLPSPRWQNPGVPLPRDIVLVRHPSLSEAEARLRQFNAQFKAARLDRFPDITVGIQHAAVSQGGLSRVSTGQDQFYGTLGINIPLWQEPRRAAEQEARAGISESEANLASVRDELEWQLSETRARVDAQQRLIELFDDRILNEARQTFEVSLAGYTAGNLGFVDLIERWRRWLGYQLQQEMNRAMLGKAVAAWQQAAGILPSTSP